MHVLRHIHVKPYRQHRGILDPDLRRPQAVSVQTRGGMNSDVVFRLVSATSLVPWQMVPVLIQEIQEHVYLLGRRVDEHLRIANHFLKHCLVQLLAAERVLLVSEFVASSGGPHALAIRRHAHCLRCLHSGVKYKASLAQLREPLEW